MIQSYTQVVVADNSGAKMVRVIGAGKNIARSQIRIGSLFTASVKEAVSNGTTKRKQVVRCLLVRQRAPFRRADGSHLRFDDNAAVIVNEKIEPIGTRIFGPVPRELRAISPRIISLAPEVV